MLALTIIAGDRGSSRERRNTKTWRSGLRKARSLRCRPSLLRATPTAHRIPNLPPIQKMFSGKYSNRTIKGRMGTICRRKRLKPCSPRGRIPAHGPSRQCKLVHLCFASRAFTSEGHFITANCANGRFAPEVALGGIEIQLPLHPRKQTQFGNRGMSEKCQFRTNCPSQSGHFARSNLPEPDVAYRRAARSMSVRGWRHVCSEHAGQQHGDLLLVVAVFLTEQRDQIALFEPDTDKDVGRRHCRE